MHYTGAQFGVVAPSWCEMLRHRDRTTMLINDLRVGALWHASCNLQLIPAGPGGRLTFLLQWRKVS